MAGLSKSAIPKLFYCESLVVGCVSLFVLWGLLPLRLFQVLWNERKLLTQILHSLLELIVSHLRISHFNYIEVRFLYELTEDKLFWK